MQKKNIISDASAEHQFNFWVGEWDVFNKSGQEAGHSRIEKILKDAVILENWTGKKGYVGKSFNHYDTKLQKWFQYWIDEKPETVYFEGSFDENQNAMVFFSYDHEKDQKDSFIRRLRFFKTDENNLRQFSERSYDGGKNWTTEYDLYYKRKK